MAACKLATLQASNGLSKVLIEEKSRLKKLITYETKNYMTWGKIVRNAVLAVLLYFCSVFVGVFQIHKSLFPGAVYWVEYMSFVVLMIGVALPLLWTFVHLLPPVPTLSGTVKPDDLEDHPIFRFIARNFLINYYRSTQ